MLRAEYRSRRTSPKTGSVPLSLPCFFLASPPYFVSLLSFLLALLPSLLPALNRSHPGGPTTDGNVLMAAEILAHLVPETQGDVVARARAAVGIMREKNLDGEPGLIVPLNSANGDMVPIKPSKVKPFIFVVAFDSLGSGFLVSRI